MDEACEEFQEGWSCCDTQEWDRWTRRQARQAAGCGWGYGRLGVYSERLALDHSGQAFFFNFLNTVDLQCCVNFCCTAKWYVHSSSYSFPLSQNIEYGSLWYTVGPCCLSILGIMVYICSSQRSRILEVWPSGSGSFPLKLLQSFMHEFSFYQISKGIHD